MAHLSLTVTIHAAVPEPTSLSATALDLGGTFGNTGTVQVLDQQGQPFIGPLEIVSSNPALTATNAGGTITVTATPVPADTTATVEIS